MGVVATLSEMIPGVVQSLNGILPGDGQFVRYKGGNVTKRKKEAFMPWQQCIYKDSEAGNSMVCDKKSEHSKTDKLRRHKLLPSSRHSFQQMQQFKLSNLDGVQRGPSEETEIRHSCLSS